MPNKPYLEIKQTNQTFKHDNVTGTHCPDCIKLMLKVNGKHGTMLVCPGQGMRPS
ncbi:hypothetical protein ACEQPO_03215 [Bacillus sp. SL00103]